jgi:hypothetical protein
VGKLPTGKYAGERRVEVDLFEGAASGIDA